MIVLRPFEPAYRAFLVELGKAAAQEPALGVGYPRWESWDEVLAELEVYAGSPETDLFIVFDDDRQPLGYTGWLGEPGDEHAFLVPPVVVAGLEPAVVTAALGAIEARAAARFRRLTASLRRENTVLVAACAERGWARRKEQIEMKRARGGATKPAHTAGVPGAIAIGPLPTASSASVAQAAAVVREVLGGGGDAEARLRENAERNVVRVAIDAAGVCGVVVADPMQATSFSRIEELAVAERARGRGIGRALLEAAIAALPGPAERDVFLSVDPEAKAALRLYRRIGFVETLHTLVLTKALADESA